MCVCLFKLISVTLTKQRRDKEFSLRTYGQKTYCYRYVHSTAISRYYTRCSHMPNPFSIVARCGLLTFQAQGKRSHLPQILCRLAKTKYFYSHYTSCELILDISAKYCIRVNVYRCIRFLKFRFFF